MMYFNIAKLLQCNFEHLILFYLFDTEKPIWYFWIVCDVTCDTLVTPFQYGPVTMIIPASGHQVRCIPWVQMGTFNKEISFLCGLKFFALNIFCGEYLQSSLHLMLQIHV